VSARWPGDVHQFAQTLAEQVARSAVRDAAA
jgi:hypothetical protein